MISPAEVLQMDDRPALLIACTTDAQDTLPRAVPLLFPLKADPQCSRRTVTGRGNDHRLALAVREVWVAFRSPSLDERSELDHKIDRRERSRARRGARPSQEQREEVVHRRSDRGLREPRAKSPLSSRRVVLVRSSWQHSLRPTHLSSNPPLSRQHALVDADFRVPHEGSVHVRWRIRRTRVRRIRIRSRENTRPVVGNDIAVPEKNASVHARWVGRITVSP